MRSFSKNEFVGIYIRVSSKKQAKAGKGEEVQRDICERIARSNGCQIYKTYYNPNGVSGDVKIKHRPEFMEMLQDGKNKKITTVIVAHMDRLGRKGQIMDKALDMLFDVGLKIFVNSMFIENTLMGRLVAGIQGQLAQYDKGQLLERMSAGMEKATIQRGEKQGLVPYGYKRVGSGEKLKILVVETEADVIRKIYEARENGMTQQKIADMLNEQAIKPYKVQLWSQKTISQILSPGRREIYEGCMRNEYNTKHKRWPLILTCKKVLKEDNPFSHLPPIKLKIALPPVPNPVPNPVLNPVLNPVGPISGSISENHLHIGKSLLPQLPLLPSLPSIINNK